MDRINNFLRDVLIHIGGYEITWGSFLIILGILLAARLGLWSLRKLFARINRSRRIPIDTGRQKAFLQIGRYMLYLVAFILILNTIGITVTNIVTVSAALLVGVGIGFQSTFNDLFSGIMILLDGTVEVDDVIEIDSLGLVGKVKEIKLRTSVVETPDRTIVIVPNSRFTSQNVVNWSHGDPSTRFRIKVGVAYGSNVSLVRKVLKEVAHSHGQVMQNPEPKIFFNEFGDSSLVFELLFWSKHNFEIEAIKSDLRFKIEAEFRRHDIVIPFPQRTLHLRRGEDIILEEEA